MSKMDELSLDLARMDIIDRVVCDEKLVTDARELLKQTSFDKAVQLISEALETTGLREDYQDQLNAIIECQDKLNATRERMDRLEELIASAPYDPTQVASDDRLFLDASAYYQRMKERNTDRWNTPAQRSLRARKLKTLYANAEKTKVQLEAAQQRLHAEYCRAAALQEIVNEDATESKLDIEEVISEHQVLMEGKREMALIKERTEKKLAAARDSKKRRRLGLNFIDDEAVEVVDGSEYDFVPDVNEDV